jgi:hypothetical protein
MPNMWWCSVVALLRRFLRNSTPQLHNFALTPLDYQRNMEPHYEAECPRTPPRNPSHYSPRTPPHPSPSILTYGRYLRPTCLLLPPRDRRWGSEPPPHPSPSILTYGRYLRPTCLLLPPRDRRWGTDPPPVV